MTSLVALTRGVPQGSAVGSLLFPSSKNAKICLHLGKLRCLRPAWTRSALTLDDAQRQVCVWILGLCCQPISAPPDLHPPEPFYTHFKLHLHPLISHDPALSDWPASPQTSSSFSYLYLLEKTRYEAVVLSPTGGGEFGKVAFLFSY